MKCIAEFVAVVAVVVVVLFCGGCDSCGGCVSCGGFVGCGGCDNWDGRGGLC